MKKIIISLIAVIIITIAGLSLSLGKIARSAIEEAGSKMLGANIRVEEIDVSVLGGRLDIKNLIVGNPEGFVSDHAFALGEILVQLDIASVFSDTVVINSIAVKNPEINYEVGMGKTNINTLLGNINSGKPAGSAAEDNGAGAETTGSKKVVIEDLLIKDAKVQAKLSATGAELKLPEIHLTNIGKEGDSVSFRQALGKVMAAVVASLAQTDLASLIGGNTMENATKAAKDLLDNVGGAIKGMFK